MLTTRHRFPLGVAQPESGSRGRMSALTSLHRSSSNRRRLADRHRSTVRHRRRAVGDRVPPVRDRGCSSRGAGCSPPGPIKRLVCLRPGARTEQRASITQPTRSPGRSSDPDQAWRCSHHPRLMQCIASHVCPHPTLDDRSVAWRPTSTTRHDRHSYAAERAVNAGHEHYGCGAGRRRLRSLSS